VLAAALAAWLALAGPGRGQVLIGYSELRTDRPGGRHANVSTMRAYVITEDGTGRRPLAEELAREPDAWAQFLGWSPDGTLAVVARGWQHPDNAAWEEKNRAFRVQEGAWRHDLYLLDMGGGAVTNVTAVERTSHFNSGLFFWPGESGGLGFQALVGGQMRPFRMDRDGHNKRDLSGREGGFTEGLAASPCGRRIAYVKDGQLYLAGAEGGGPRPVRTGRRHHDAPQWSPDGKWLLFLAGEPFDTHPHVVRPDGTGVRRLACRRGHTGSVPVLDVEDFHGGCGDYPAWSPDSSWVYYTAKVGRSVELMRASLRGQLEQLTRSPAGCLTYHPEASPDGTRVLFGSNRGGVRQLYVLELASRKVRPLTDVPRGRAALWGHWRPTGKG
jgi:hypothetical protein